MKQPLVTIGVPVFNGEEFVEDAVRSAMAQTFRDIEIVISDNASTDRTADILATLAAEDPRIRIFRNSTNLGAAPNYNRCFEEGRGTFFKWLAHDDRMKPTFVKIAVDALTANPEAVLVNATTEYIDEIGVCFSSYDSELRRASGEDAVNRFAAMVIRSHSCVDFFGLARRDAMVGSLLHGSFHGADRAYLAQMALRGPLLQISDHLIEMREHSRRYTRMKQKLRDRESWHDARAKRGWHLPTLRLYREYLAMVGAEKLSRSERLRCYGVLAKWWVANWNGVRVGVDIASLAFPRFPEHALQVKKAIFGLAPGHFDLETAKGKQASGTPG